MVNNQYVNPWTERDDELARTMLGDGYCIREVAEGLSRTSVAVRFRNSAKWHIRVTRKPLRTKLCTATKEELEELYWGKMLTSREIGDIYHVTGTSVCTRMKILGIPRRKGGFRIRPNLEPSQELAYVLGVLLGDGSVFPINSNSSYAIQLMCTSKDFVKSFAKALKQIGLHPCFFDAPQQNPNWNKQYGVKGHSVIFGKWYKTLTLSKVKSLLQTRKMVVSFLRGLYESEGHTDTPTPNSRRVNISNTDPELLALAEDLVRSLGYKVSLHRAGGKERDLYIRGHCEDKEKFLREIDPCIKGVN